MPGIRGPQPERLARRQLLQGAAGALLGAALPLPARTRRLGHLVIIGGAEDRLEEKRILHRFVELAGGPQARIGVITAASGEPGAVWPVYEQAFRRIGVAHCERIALDSRLDAQDPAVVDALLQVDGLFMSGGDQSRLMACLWDTPAARAIHRAYHVRGCCIGGTSAGAAAMSRQMLAQGTATPVPEKQAVSLDLGLGLVPNAIIDQHFSERRRLGRLLSALAQRPDLLGVGIDEDTALVIRRGQAVEILGDGAVTLIDGRRMRTDFGALDPYEKIEMTDVKLHVLPAGRHYLLHPPAQPLPPRFSGDFLDALRRLADPGPQRG